MKILKTRRLKSCTTFYCEAEQEEIDIIIVEGLRRFAKESGFTDIKAVPACEFTKGIVKLMKRAKKHELSDGEYQLLLNIGFCSIICGHTGSPFPSLDTFDKFPVPRKKKVT